MTQGTPSGQSGTIRGGRRDWTQGSVLHNLLSLSWPMVVSNLMLILGPTIDMIWVGKLGINSIAGVGAAGIAVQMQVTAMMGLIMGVRAMISRHIGAGDIAAANHVAQQGFVLAGAVAVIMAAVGIFFTEAILGIFGLEPGVIAEGVPYLRINFVGGATIIFRLMTDSVMQASGDSMTPMVTGVVYRVFHIVLCPFLMFGLWIFPEMGVSGAAITNVISQSLGFVLALWFLLKGRTVYFDLSDWRRRPAALPTAPDVTLADSPSRWNPARVEQARMQLTFRDFRLDPGIIWGFIRIGLPAMVSGVQRTLGHYFLIVFVSPFGTAAVAAHTIIQRVEMLLTMPGMAFGQTSGVLAGQNLGAGRPNRAERGIWLAIVLVEVFLIAVSVAIFIGADGIVRIFSSEPDTVKLAGSFLRIAVAGYVVLGLTMVLMNALPGTGDTLPPMIIILVTTWLIQLPLAYFLSQSAGLGVLGVRWAIVSGMVVGGIIYLLYFRAGRWKSKKV